MYSYINICVFDYWPCGNVYLYRYTDVFGACNKNKLLNWNIFMYTYVDVNTFLHKTTKFIVKTVK